MTRFLAILAALTCAASAQTFRTVTADTNNVIRTNFTLGAAQVSGAFAISNITGLQSALDAKLGTNGDAFALTNFPALLLRTNGSASSLTNFPASILQTNSSLSSFPAGLLRTNGDGSGLTNLPNADLGSATGVLPLANGGTGATNASAARTALELGTAATNDATAFQPANTNLTALASGDGSSLTNVTVTDASTLTNFPAELLRTNGDAAGLTNFPAELLRTNGDGSGLSNVSVDLTAVLPSYSNNAGKVLAVASGETNVEWTAISNTVTDGSLITNFPSYLLQTNGDAAGLTNFPAELLRTNGSAAGLTAFPASLLTTNGDASGLTNFPTFNQNTTGTASNVTGVVAIANGGTGGTTASNARVNLLPAYTGNELRVLALNSNATDVVWAVDGGGQANLTNVTGTLGLANGGTGATNASGAVANLGISPNGGAQIGSSATNAGSRGAAIGHSAQITNVTTFTGGGAVGFDSRAANGFGGGENARANTGAAVGFNANSQGGGGAAVGRGAVVTNGEGGAVGRDSQATNGFAGGQLAKALAAMNVQLGTGTNTDNNTVQFLSAGTVDTNEWSRLAALSTYPTTNISIVGTNNTNTLVFSNGILVEVQ